MKNEISLIFGIVLIIFECGQREVTNVRHELLQGWSVLDSVHLNFFDFATISEFDNYQYKHKALFDSIKVILPLNGYGIELIPEGNKLQNDLFCIVPLPDDRIIRFQFLENGEVLVYNEKNITPDESKDIVINRLKEAKYPNQQIISLVFKDSIKKEFVCESLGWINDGYITYVTEGLPPDSTITELNDLNQKVKETLETYRLIYGIGRMD